MMSLKVAILALSVSALPLTAFAQATAPVGATKPAPSAGLTGNANTGIVPPKAGVNDTRADARIGSSVGTKAAAGTTTNLTEAKAAGAVKAKPAVKKTDKHSAVTTHRKHVASAKPAVKNDTKSDTTVR
jgi:hypothetical protein